MNKFENPNDFYEQRDDRKGMTGSIVLHLLLVVGIIVSVLSQPEAPSGPIQLELWTEGTEQIVAPPAETRTPNPAEEDTRAPEEEPEPESTPEPKPAPPPPPPPEEAPKLASTQQEDPEIALEKKRKEEQAAQAKALAEKQAKEKAEREAKQLAEKKHKEQEAKEKAEREAKELAEQKRKEQETKEKAERQAKELAEKKAKEKAEREAKAKADARLAEQNRAKANSQGDALRAAMRGDVNSRAGIKGGQNDRNQMGGGGGTSDYVRKVKACVEPRLRFSGNQRLKLTYRVEFDDKYKVTNARVTVTSGNKAFDNAVVNALKQCDPFPKPPNNNKFVTGPYDFRPK